MKGIFCLFLILVLFTSCSSYKYYHPTPNQALFHGPWEVQVVGDAGTSGLSAKGAISLPSNIGVIGMYKGGGIDQRGHEGEVGVGYYSLADPSGIFALGGIGFGSHTEYQDSTYTEAVFEGRFIRPFAQINMGIDGGRIGSVIRGDVVLSLKAERFYYSGQYLDGSGDRIRSGYSVFEPSFVYGLGVKSFKLTMSMGFPFRPSFEPLSGYSNARTFPATFGVGMRFVFNRPEG